MTIQFDDELKNEVLKLQAETKLIAKKRHKRSKLDIHATRLLGLYREGTTKAQLQRWLLSKGISANWTTVKRWIDKNG